MSAHITEAHLEKDCHKRTQFSYPPTFHHRSTSILEETFDKRYITGVKNEVPPSIIMIYFPRNGNRQPYSLILPTSKVAIFSPVLTQSLITSQ